MRSHEDRRPAVEDAAQAADHHHFLPAVAKSFHADGVAAGVIGLDGDGLPAVEAEVELAVAVVQVVEVLMGAQADGLDDRDGPPISLTGQLHA